MEKIYKILAVFGLLMLAITYSMYARERKFREYYFSKRINLPFPGDPDWDLLFIHAAVGEEGARITDSENQLSFSPGIGPTLLVSDAATGNTIATIPLEEKAEALVFDPATRLIYSCSAEGALTIIRQGSRGIYKIAQRLLIPKGCHTLILDPKTGRIYLPVEGSVLVYTNE